MNIKIVIDERGSTSIRATVYNAETKDNIGTLWMTSQEFEIFTETISNGLPETCYLEIVDPNEY